MFKNILCGCRSCIKYKFHKTYAQLYQNETLGIYILSIKKKKNELKNRYYCQISKFLLLLRL